MPGRWCSTFFQLFLWIFCFKKLLFKGGTIAAIFLNPRTFWICCFKKLVVFMEGPVLTSQSNSWTLLFKKLVILRGVGGNNAGKLLDSNICQHWSTTLRITNFFFQNKKSNNYCSKFWGRDQCWKIFESKKLLDALNKKKCYFWQGWKDYSPRNS